MTRTFCDSCQRETTDAQDGEIPVTLEGTTFVLCAPCADTLATRWRLNRAAMKKKPARADVSDPT